MGTSTPSSCCSTGRRSTTFPAAPTAPFTDQAPAPHRAGRDGRTDACGGGVDVGGTASAGDDGRAGQATVYIRAILHPAVEERNGDTITAKPPSSRAVRPEGRASMSMSPDGGVVADHREALLADRLGDELRRERLFATAGPSRWPGRCSGPAADHRPEDAGTVQQQLRISGATSPMSFGSYILTGLGSSAL